MSDSISLLPEELRKKEEGMKNNQQPQKAPEPTELKFFIPAEEGEDIEIIEVDEGEIEQVLANEPLVTRFAYHVTTFFEELKAKLFQPRETAAPAKTPPQFFKPPMEKAAAAVSDALEASAPKTEAGKVVSTPVAPAKPVQPGTSVTASAKPTVKAQITPFAKTPRRVRVIKRVRKPLRVSFVSAEEMKLLRVDVPKRRFTFFTTIFVFLVILAGGYGLLRYQITNAQASLDGVNKQIADTRQEVDVKLQSWSAFQNLEPKLRSLSELLDAHVSPVRLLKEIEQVTVPTVYYESFALSSDRKVNLAVVADNFESAARQLTAFRNSDFIKRADSTSFTAVYDTVDTAKIKGVQFQLTLSLKDDALLPEEPEQPIQ